MSAEKETSGAVGPHDEDECVCGDTRQDHYSGDGSSMLNIVHWYMGRESCDRFQLYKRATATPQEPPNPSPPHASQLQGASAPAHPTPPTPTSE